MRSIYLIGSLRNPEVPRIAEELRRLDWDVFDDWYAAGERADDSWQSYETARGHDYAGALAGHAARHVFEYDRHHLDRCSAALMILPAGKSAHLELGYVIGNWKPGYILLPPTVERFDVMYNFASAVFRTEAEMLAHLRE